jgi:hypothetical protein
MTDYRAQLLASVEEMQSQQFRQQLREMTEEQLDAAICNSFGLPRGTVLTEEQLEMLIESHKMRKG